LDDYVKVPWLFTTVQLQLLGPHLSGYHLCMELEALGASSPLDYVRRTGAVSRPHAEGGIPLNGVYFLSVA